MDRTHTRARRALVLAACVLLALVCVAGATAPAPAASAGGSHPAREAAAKTKLAAVRADIARIAKSQHTTAAKRDAINGKLAAQAAQLDQAAAALHGIDTGIAAKTSALAGLQQQRAHLQARLSGQRAAMADLLRAVYTLGYGSEVPLLLGDADIAKIERALAYSRYFQRDREKRIRALLGEITRLNEVKASIEAARQGLQHEHDQRSAQAAKLAAARGEQKQLLATADAKLKHQKGQLAALHQQVSALKALLKRLQNVFADIPKQVGDTPPFAHLRGKLPWPVAGKPRAGSGLLAHGLVITAKPGAEVKAVAYGRVAWANFMRGYGMLVIIDHGDGWMSLYGGNEATLVAAGDWVQPGQPIATVGANPAQGGAWFGLRHDGKPVDPQGWFAHRR